MTDTTTPTPERRRYQFELSSHLCFDVSAASKDEAWEKAYAFAREAHEYAHLTEVEWPKAITEVGLAFEDLPDLVDVLGEHDREEAP